MTIGVERLYPAPVGGRSRRPPSSASTVPSYFRPTGGQLSGIFIIAGVAPE